jgi:hypothetical protein
MRFLLVLLIVCFVAMPTTAGTITSFKAAMDKGLIKVNAMSTGKVYHGKALKLQVSNTTQTRLQLAIDAALIFKPAETQYQDLVLPAEEAIALAPGGTVEVEVQTFCGKMHGSAPGAKLVYKFWKQGDSNLIKVAQYIRKNDLYDYLGQQGIWAITDNTDLENIVDPSRPKQSAELLALLVKLTGRPTPEHFKLYRLDTVAGQPVFTKRVLKIYTNLEWKLAEPATISMGIYNRVGDLVQGILDNEPMKKGGYKMMVQFLAEGAPPGNYYLRLFNGDKIIQEKTIKVE